MRIVPLFEITILVINGSNLVQLQTDGNKSEAFFTNCLFYKNENYAISLYSISTQSASAYINNCIFINEQTNNLSRVFNGVASFQVSNCLFSLPNCAALGYTNTTVICNTNNLFGLDPLFINPSESDFHLQPCSPAINTGANAILDSLDITTDLDGKPRIRNGVVDMGPYETLISLHPGVAAQPACAGASDGAIEFSPDICPPYNFVWSNGQTTGTNTEGLAAGNYVFTATGSNNIPVSDTLIISEPLPLEVTAVAKDAHCYGFPSGRVETFVSGGTPSFQYYWDPPLPPLASHYNLPLGTYFVTVTDANSCTAATQASIGSPDPIQVFYTIQDVTCMGCSDGSIVFDSIIGGTNPPLPASMFDLPAGHYCLTITDAAGCTIVPCFTINVTSDTKEETINHLLKLSPNPTSSGETASMEWLGNEPASLRVLDLKGRLLEKKTLVPGASAQLIAHWPSGIYQVEIRMDSGKRGVLRWAIF